jgi:FkbM family methyltransferase
VIMVKHNWLKSVAGTIYSALPESRLRQWLRQRLLYRLTSVYALDKMVTDTGFEPDGTFFVELNNGTKLYGEPDRVPVRDSLIPRLQKLRELKQCDGVLGLLCYVYVTRDYERYYQLAEGDCVIDAGANIGTFTVRAAQAVGEKGKVIAIEPEARNLEFLRRNIAANNLRNVLVIPKGVWGAKGKLRLNISWNQTGHSVFRGTVYGTDKSKEYEEVEVDSIDGILAELGIEKVDFVKMDIEGAEVEAIKGMENILKNGNVKLAMEYTHIVDGQTTDTVVIPWLKSRGFKVRKHGELLYAWKEGRP